MHIPRLDFLSLKTRISLGFTLICSLLVIIGLASYFGFVKSENQFLQFTKLSTQAEIHIDIERNVSELQRQVQQFTYEGHETAENKVYSLFETLNKDLIFAQKATTVEETKRIIGKMINHLKIYLETFNDVIIERKLRFDLVQRKLRDNAKKVENIITEYIQIENEDKELTHSLKAQYVLNSILMSEKDILRYFNILDSSLIKKSKMSFIDIQANIDNLIKEEESEAEISHKQDNKIIEIKLLKNTQHMISEYERVFLRAVQATRGYLYLVNVVMAGEASEFLYNANKLKKLSADNMLNIQQTLILLIKRISLITGIITIVTVALGVILSWLVSRSITIPVTKITKTFKLLARGEYPASIPGHDFKDEIGDLSRAADVFKEKNRQTEHFLKESQILTKELEKNRKELARSNEEMEQFVYTVSHDLKSPLVTSTGFIGMIKDLADKGEYETAVNKLERVEKANSRMGQLINDLLELSRVGRVDLDKKNIDMNIILKNFKECLSHKLKKEQFELELETDFPTIYINESRTLQIFENLMSNAFKYARGNHTKNSVKIGYLDSEKEHRFYVSDNGPGIPKEYHEKIFGLFTRLDNSTEGTGIGLSVVRKVMQFHEGRVWVESEIGTGTTFWLAFPK